MNELSASGVASHVRAAILDAAVTLREDVAAAMETAARTERSERGRIVLEQLLENARIAQSQRVPLCQDTGTVWVHLEVGAETCVVGDLQTELDRAVATAYQEGHLRMSTVRDALLDRSNRGDDGPAFVEISARSGTGATVSVMLKGGGSDNASRVAMLVPADGWDGITRFVLETVEASAAGACPPLVIGVGVGGTFDTVAGLAKRALLRRLDVPTADPRIAELEVELLAAVNSTGIGPAALGGDTTALGVRIVTAPCHIAALPVAINMGCNAIRSVTLEVT